MFYRLDALTYLFSGVLTAAPIALSPPTTCPLQTSQVGKRLSWDSDPALASSHFLRASAYLFIFFLCVLMEKGLAIHPHLPFLP